MHSSIVRIQALFWGLVLSFVLFPTFFNPVEARSCRRIFDDHTLEDFKSRGYLENSQSQNQSQGLRNNKALKIVTWNLLNLKIPEAEYPAGSQAQKTTHRNQQMKFAKSAEMLSKMKRVLDDLDADIYVFQEVFSAESLRHLVREYMGDKYEVVLERGNDERGINVGFLVKKSLNVTYELQSHKNLKYEHNYGVYPAGTPVFARDLPALFLRQKDGSNSRAKDDPDLIVFGAHFKSKRPTDGDFESTSRREVEAKAAAEIVQAINSFYKGRVPIVLGGDFNTQIMTAKETESLRSVLKDSLTLMGDKLTEEQKVTHTYHPNGGRPHFNQVDAQLLNDVMAQKLLESRVYRFKDENGQEIEYQGKWETKIHPLNFRQRKKNPSDHMPIISIYDMTK